MLFSLKRRRLCHTVLAALRGAYGFAPAQAAISIAAKTARVPHGQRHHVSAAGSLARSCGCAARRPRSARHCFRDLLMTLDRLCRYSLPLAFRAENAALALRAPSMPHDHAAAGRHLCSRCPQAPLRPATGTAPAGPPSGRPPWLAGARAFGGQDSFNTILQQSEYSFTLYLV